MKPFQGTAAVRNSFPTIPALMFAAVALLAPGQGVAIAQTISWIDVGIRNQSCGGSANIAFNPTTSRLYQAGWTDSGEATVAVIDVATDAVTQDGERLVSHELFQLPGFRFFYCFDSNAEQGQYLAVNPATNRIYMLGHIRDAIGQYSDLALAVMDGATNDITYVTPFGGEELFPYTGWDVGIAVNPTTNRIYFAGATSGGPVVVVVDGATLEVIRRYPQPTWVDPDWPGVTCTFTPNAGIAVNPNTNRVYLTGRGVGTSCDRFLGVINEATGELTVLPKYARSADHEYFYFQASSTRQVTVDTSANRVFVRGASSMPGVNDEVIALDEASGGVEVISGVSVNSNFGGIAVNSSTHRLYIFRRPDLLSVVDLVTGNERIAVDLPPDWSFDMSYNNKPAIDVGRNRLYALSEFGWVVVVDLGTSEVPSGSNMSVQADSASITFESVTTAGSITATPIADPSIAGQVPGGFAISDLVAYQITPSSSLVFSGTAVTCFQMPGIDDPETFASLRVLHMEDGVLVDRTSSHEFSTRTLCAATTSFSPFYVARATNHVKVLFDQTRAYRAGSTIPIRVQMLDRAGANISSSSLALTTRGLTSIGTATVLPVNDAGNANPDSAFRYDPALVGYIFNLKTTGLPTGRHVLSFWAGVDRSFFYAVVFDVR